MPKSEGISILISVYQGDEFISECLEAIDCQTYFENNNKFEVLVGVDGCDDTLYTLMEDGGIFRNVRVFMSEDNVGTYKMLNALAQKANYDLLLRFDVDDIMKPEMIKDMISLVDGYDAVQVGYDNIMGQKREVISRSFFPSDGVIMIKKGLFESLGGYKSWRCCADRDLIKRIRKDLVGGVDRSCFYRRMHDNSLSNNEHIGIGTDTRRKRLNAIEETQVGEKADMSIAPCVEMSKFSSVEKKDVSVVIPAYNATNFIEECLDSIERQLYFRDNDNFEVVVCADGCYGTLNKVMSIRHKYRNLRILVNKGNCGVYVTLNSLIKEASYDNVVIFGADDVMTPMLVSKAMFAARRYDIVQFWFYHFTDNIENAKDRRGWGASGAVLIKKRVFEKAGAFRPWWCSADAELLLRVSNYYDIHVIRDRLFYRRGHSESLTLKADTGMKSELRKSYKEQTRVYSKGEDIWVEPQISDYEEIPRKITLVLCVPIYKRPEISDFVLAYYSALKEGLEGSINIVLLCCGSEGEQSRAIAEKNGFTYLEYPNEPLTQKLNILYKTAAKFKPDACIKVDSDNLLSKEFFLYYAQLAEGGYDYAGIMDVWFAFRNRLCYWGGYTSHREGETVGAGRYLSARLLDAMDWRPWGDAVKNKSMDGLLTEHMSALDISVREHSVYCGDIGGACVDLKSNIGLSQLGGFKYDGIYNIEKLEWFDIEPIKDKLIDYGVSRI